MMRHRRQVQRIVALLALALSAQVAARSADNYLVERIEATPLTAGILSAQPGPSTTLLDRIGHFISSIFSIDESSGMGGDGGLFGGDGSSIAWGGSTLEVVKTQATYLTRAAAFGPRITSDDGLKGGLLPISDFYHPVNKSGTRSIRVENYGCPYRGGPGWKDEDFEDDGGGESFQPSEAMQVKGPSKPPKDWIALIERGGQCSFASKVRVAQALGAEAVVVGDAPSPEYDDGKDNPGEQSDPGLSGRLVTMYAPGDTSDIKIPSTFITRPSYVDLIRLVDEIEREGQDKCVLRKKEGKDCNSRENGLEVILGRDDIMWEWPLIDLAFILLLLPSFMTLTTIIVHRIRLSRQRRRERAPELVVLGLPCLIWRPDGQPWEKVEGSEAGATTGKEQRAVLGKDITDSNDMELGGTQIEEEQGNQAGPSSTPLKTIPVPPPPPVRQHAYLPPGRTYYSCDECAICLSEFVDGDKVRVLPCGHVFHLPEIDSWLLRVKKLCPICKRDITVPVPPTPPTPTLHNPASPNSGAETAVEEDVTDDDAAAAPTEESPLLARSQ